MNLQTDYTELHTYLEENGTSFEQVEERIIALNKQMGNPIPVTDDIVITAIQLSMIQEK